MICEALAFLSSTFWGFLVDEVFSAIVERVAHRLLGKLSLASYNTYPFLVDAGHPAKTPSQ
jgi:hypothetical protein